MDIGWKEGEMGKGSGEQKKRRKKWKIYSINDMIPSIFYVCFYRSVYQSKF